MLESFTKLSHQFGPVAVQAARGLYRSRLPQMAAALAYRTIFALVPVIIIGLVILRIVTNEADLRGYLNNSIDFLGLRPLVAAELVADDPDERIGDESAAIEVPIPDSFIPDSLAPWDETVLEPEVATNDPSDDDTIATQPDTAEHTEAQQDAQEDDTQQQHRIDAVVDGVLDHFSKIPFKAIGGFGVLLLIYAAISMLVEVERAFNQIYRAPRGRSWVRRITQYWSVLTLGVIMMVASFYVGQRFNSLLSSFASSEGVFSQQGVVFGIIGYLSTVAISTTLLLFMYKTIPNVRVPFGPAVIGAVVAAVLWEAGKWGFTRYLSVSTSYQYIYGSIAIIPMFILWVYLTWLIVLFGLQVSFGLQYASSARGRAGGESSGPIIVDAVRAVDIAVLLASRFDDGNAVDADDAAAALDLPTDVCAIMLDQLERSGLVRRIEQGESDAEPAWVLAQPASKMQVRDVLASVTENAKDDASSTTPIPSSEQTSAASSITDAMLSAIAGKTIADCLEPSNVELARIDGSSLA